MQCEIFQDVDRDKLQEQVNDFLRRPVKHAGIESPPTVRFVSQTEAAVVPPPPAPNMQRAVEHWITISVFYE